MKEFIAEDWRNLLIDEFEKRYFKELSSFLELEYQTKTCFPKFDSIFEAFNKCRLNNLKVIIIGQDPYHGKGQANGLCFSVNEGVVFPPSLTNIFKEIKSDLGKTPPISGNLSHWAEQGVLLLNATLTVRESEAGSHQQKGWEDFTDAVITSISKEKEHIVFLLWGGFAKKKGRKIDKKKHIILESGHPSPLSANRGYWFGNKHFSLVNNHLISLGLNPINW